MRPFVAVALDWIDDHPDMSQPDRASLVASVPAGQWASDFWEDLAPHCGERMAVFSAPQNGRKLAYIETHMETDKAAPRCLSQPPDGRGITQPGRSAAWLLSGGSVQDYGECNRRGCPRCAIRAAGEAAQ